MGWKMKRWWASVLAMVVMGGWRTADLWACNTALISVPSMIEMSDVVLLAEVVGFTAVQTGGPGSVQLRVLRVLKGRVDRGALIVSGNLSGHHPMWNQSRPVPYTHLDCMRASNCGSCFAYDYQAGSQYLLFLKGDDPYWAPLAPANEEVAGADDPWLVWVTQYLAEHRLDMDPQISLRGMY